METGRGRILIITLIAAVAILVSGCMQSGTADRCGQYADTLQKDQCLDYMASWYQDPYACYGIQDIMLREKCLDKSINPAEARKVQSEAQVAKNTTVVVDETAAKNQSDVVKSIDNARVSRCVDEKKLTLDGCMKEIAIETADMTLCAKISAPEYRMPCITNVAVVAKDPKLCDALTGSDEKGLCKYYSGTG